MSVPTVGARRRTLARVDQRRVRSFLVRPGSPWGVWIAFGLLLAATGAFLYHETRGTTLFSDEWSWAVGRRGSSLSTFLSPYNQQLVLVPVAVYKLLFAIVGIGNYVPYRVIVIALHLVCGLLLFVYAKRRVGAFLALLASALLLLLGPGWQNMIWPNGMAPVFALVAGVGVLLMLDRGDRMGDAGACALTAVSLASTGIGLAVAIGLAAELALTRRLRRDAWIVAGPLALYALWWILYQPAGLSRHTLVLTPGYVASEAATALAALLGLAGPTGSGGQGTLLVWGAPLLVAALAIAGWRIARLRPVPPQVITLVTMLLLFWILTALSRATLGLPYSSRYLYAGGLFVLLLATELSRGISLDWRASVALGMVTVAAAVSNIGVLRDAARQLRTVDQVTAADLGAFEIGRQLAPGNYMLAAFMGPPWGIPIMRARSYVALMRALGTPAASATAIATYPENARMAADEELIRMHSISLRAPSAGERFGPPPPLDSASGGSVRAHQGCLTFTQSSFLAVGERPEIAVTVPPAGLLLRAGAAAATVRIRRFADEFQTVGTLAGDATATLQIAPDRSARPWHLQLTASGRAVLCGLR